MEVQEYFIHLIGGERICICEEIHLPHYKRLVSRFAEAKDDQTLTLGDDVMGFYYVPSAMFCTLKAARKDTDNVCKNIDCNF